ncbi:hypothetical protein SO3561_08720 [Streptomyces olivochromogenes]|uniref:Uncharacterized protein n=1 Tax=Streptomyces olivochromogenes TaxID=1963 RepID=A0A250VT52_STROL|nr:hypothetical protein SO3561_08720 [Streptomyces olivochromogenes]
MGPCSAEGARSYRNAVIRWGGSSLSRRIAGHPYWQTAAGTPAARMALKELARAKAQS